MKKLATIDRTVCVACGACANACPRNALSIQRGCYAIMDADKCVGCGLCVNTCPAGCISTAERSAVK